MGDDDTLRDDEQDSSSEAPENKSKVMSEDGDTMGGAMGGDEKLATPDADTDAEAPLGYNKEEDEDKDDDEVM